MCPYYNTCKFIEKYKDTEDEVLKGLITHYCRGSENADCVRKNLDPSNIPADLVPSGAINFD